MRSPYIDSACEEGHCAPLFSYKNRKRQAGDGSFVGYDLAKNNRISEKIYRIWKNKTEYFFF